MSVGCVGWRLGLLLAACWSLTPTGVAAQERVVPKGELRLIYCHREADGADAPWQANGLVAIGRMIAMLDQRPRTVIRRNICDAQIPDATCFAGPGGLACRAHAIARLLRAAAYLLAQWMVDGAPKYETFQNARDRAVVDAFRYADQGGAGTQVAELVERIRRADGSPDGSPERDDLAGALVPLFRFVADRLVAVLIGHELAHVSDEQCPIAEESVAERSGTWRAALSSHQAGGLFCKQSLVPSEVGADRCALRFLRMLDRKADAVARSQYAEAARRLAGDLAAYAGFFGVRPTSSSGLPVPVLLEGYLHAPFRSLLFAAEIHGDRGRPAVCGTAARIFVNATQLVVRQCGGKEIVEDAILALMPAGVEASWNGAPWTNTSWACE